MTLNNVLCTFTDITFDIYLMLRESAVDDSATLLCTHLDTVSERLPSLRSLHTLSVWTVLQYTCDV